MTTPHRIFAYGSNMNLPDLARWLRERGYPPMVPERTERAFLDGWDLVWNYRSPIRKSGAANVAPVLEHSLPGVLLHVDEPLLLAIDQKEGHPHRYRRRLIAVRSETSEITEAWVYVVTPEWTEPGFVPPSKRYRDVVVQGAEQMGLPEAHIAPIRALNVFVDD